MVSTNLLIRADEAADFLTVVGSPHRLLILLQLRTGAEVSVNALAEHLQIPQPLLSMHLRTLRRLRLVQTRRDSQRVYYSCNSSRVWALFSFLEEFYGEGDSEAEMRSAPAAAS
ncbi:ArsR/SmtB family transcription factor [Mesorhizobium sp. CO1-1-8]|uniref:ArsR/SmtB family transcription factor n=1 Tax=Mesorhizobium sp. CO1-1-8 TaxID=2876631 RepID=UPI001CD13586|nr:metalloregulator ArsR/SmtB family transcription factor [Mesorhizobium sp. CO1-1-8]MBZ9776060.1 metalloregulator ArsR/SmtB family transcription factor [Mesorhizobium sp. CO1-1-8]